MSIDVIHPSMDFETAFNLVDAAVFAQTQRHLKDIELTILRSSWQGQKYDEIAQAYGYTTDYLQHDVGPKLWQMLSKAFGEKVSKKNFQATLERRLSYTAASPKQLEAGLQPQMLVSSVSQPKIEKVASHEENKKALLTILPPKNTDEQPQSVAETEFPTGQVSLASSFYIERPPIEERCYQEILQPGALIRIKAPRQMGKTSLMVRILNAARKHGCQTVSLSFHLAEQAVFASLDAFLRWFCESVGRKLKRLAQLNDYWSIYGSKDKTTAYFEECLLEEIDSPLVISLDDVDRLFPYSDIAEGFFSLLRAWFEYAKYGDRSSEWKKLRLVLVHSKEVYVPLNINQSPFNVGLSVELQEFEQKQVQNLVERHQGLNYTDAQVEKLMRMLGGHPYLVQLALYHIQRRDITLEQLLQTAPTADGIYSDHLRGRLHNLKQHPKLATAFSQVVKSSVPIELDLELALKLHSMGLVIYRLKNKVMPSCNLYRRYFQKSTI